MRLISAILLLVFGLGPLTSASPSQSQPEQVYSIESSHNNQLTWEDMGLKDLIIVTNGGSNVTPPSCDRPQSMSSGTHDRGFKSGTHVLRLRTATDSSYYRSCYKYIYFFNRINR